MLKKWKSMPWFKRYSLSVLFGFGSFALIPIWKMVSGVEAPAWVILPVMGFAGICVCYAYTLRVNNT